MQRRSTARSLHGAARPALEDASREARARRLEANRRTSCGVCDEPPCERVECPPVFVGIHVGRANATPEHRQVSTRGRAMPEHQQAPARRSALRIRLE
jgi:hypothetical protein